MENIVLTEAVFYVLLSLHTPLHGYGIMQQVSELSHGRVNLAAGTLYGALSTMQDKGWIESLPGEQSSRKKEYRITTVGRAVAVAELARLRELVAHGSQFLEVK